jgi:2-phospho-L-lactate guanylyltransferase
VRGSSAFRLSAWHGEGPHDPGCCALVAIKRRVQCKSRLAAALPPAERLDVVRSMLAHVLAALSSAETIGEFAVVSPERDTVPESILVLGDTGEGLNEALTYAYREVIDRGAREVLILPADLPRVTSSEIDQLVRAGRRGQFALAPDADGVGTNALYLAGQRDFPFQFGEHSKRCHLAAARRLSLPECVVRLPGLALDVDEPEDLWRVRYQASVTECRA